MCSIVLIFPIFRNMNIHAILSLLDQHSEVQLDRVLVRPGCSEAVLQQYESELGVQLHPGTRAFFLAHNGVALEWHAKGHIGFDPSSETIQTDEFPGLMELLEDYGPPFDGQLIVLPLEEFLQPDLELADIFSPYGAADAHFQHHIAEDGGDGSFEFGDRSYSDEGDFRSQLRYFDFFQRDTGVSLLYEKDNSDLPVLYEPFRGGGYNARHQMPLSQYLNMAIRHFGLRHRRDLWFKRPDFITSSENPAQRLEDILKFSRGYQS